jgi:hypothetical protein
MEISLERWRFNCRDMENSLKTWRLRILIVDKVRDMDFLLETWIFHNQYRISIRGMKISLES